MRYFSVSTSRKIVIATPNTFNQSVGNSALAPNKVCMIGR